MFLLPPQKNNFFLQAPFMLLGAATLTLGLFILMAYLVKPDNIFHKKVIQNATIEMVRLVREESLLQQEDQLPEQPKEESDKPPMPEALSTPASKPQMNQPVMSMASVPLSTAPSSPFLGDFKPGQQATIATGVIPLVRVEPRYPRKAARRGLQGWVKVEFTILEDGTVADVKVVDSKPSNTFDREAMRAILRWKFQPKVVEGKAVKQRAQQQIEFKLKQ